MVPAVNGAPSSQIRFPDGSTSLDNFLALGDSETLTITFRNSADPSVTGTSADVASTIQYISVAAANENPSRALITFPSAPSWGIWNYTNVPGGVPGAYRVQGTVTTSLDTAAIFAPFSLVNTLYLYTWELGAPNASLLSLIHI